MRTALQLSPISIIPTTGIRGNLPDIEVLFDRDLMHPVYFSDYDYQMH
jgi:hypothetical protein